MRWNAYKMCLPGRSLIVVHTLDVCAVCTWYTQTVANCALAQSAAVLSFSFNSHSFAYSVFGLSFSLSDRKSFNSVPDNTFHTACTNKYSQIHINTNNTDTKTWQKKAGSPRPIKCQVALPSVMSCVSPYVPVLCQFSDPSTQHDHVT